MLAGVVLVALVVVAAQGHRLGRWGAVLLAAVSVLWLVANASMEGAVLVKVVPDHGVTAADLAGFAGLLIAAWRWHRAAA